MTIPSSLSALSTTIVFVVIVATNLFPSFTASSDSLSLNQSLRLNETLVSSDGVFELGFFRPGSSAWYLGIWYRRIKVKTYVWVANRDTAISNPTATLSFLPDGNIAVIDSHKKVNWKSNHTGLLASSETLSLRLLDNGNLVLGEYIWQSFDEPTDTLLPGMKLGWDLKKGLNRYISSWKSAIDPGTGDYSFTLDHRGFPEIFLRERETVVYRSGPWNGRRFSGVPEMAPISGIGFSFVTNPDEVYYSFSIGIGSVVSRLTVSSSGTLDRYTWMEERGEWNRFWYAPKDQCDEYRECGAFGLCDSNASPVCRCPMGFRPASPDAWALRDGSGGCVRKTTLACGGARGGDGFFEMTEMKLPESSGAAVDRNATAVECRRRCLEDCECTAYGSADVSNGGTGCVMWRGKLIDLRNYAEGGQPLYVRLAASDLQNGWPTNRIIIIVATVLASMIVLLALCLIWKRKAVRKIWNGKRTGKGLLDRSPDLHSNEVTLSRREFSGEKDREELDLPLFDYERIVIATHNFSDDYKLGQGGFGCVYKGELDEGQEIAVKRLSKSSGQGVEEFKNEVRLIARLQHINLVRLLGCCIEVDEKILIYEYMENRSLDSILFSKERGYLLDWEKRFDIICGIARGLLYLHQDSRFRIIHRDLKASNVLLDEKLTPKISDFGMARIFGRDQTEANTRRVVGTYGYMAPEYAMDGLFSVKSDTFSFGVLVLEIISGKKNRGFYYRNNELNLLGHAWDLWRKGTGLEIVDPSAGKSYSASEVLRCMQVGLLCVQERAEDRPLMSSVVLMLSSETASMPQPKNPGFCLRRSPGETESLSSRQEDHSCSVNQVTVTVIDGR